MFTKLTATYIRPVVPRPASAVVPRPASTVIAVRSGGPGIEVLMVRRDRAARFMAGARVFPGGSVDDIDRSSLAQGAVRWDGDTEEHPWRAAALRELAEEAGVVISDQHITLDRVQGSDLYDAVSRLGAHLDADRLWYISNWVTPAGLPRRFDTRFYLTILEGETDAVSDDAEVFDAVWVAPSEALARGDDGSWLVEMPTRVHLELLAALADTESVRRHCASVVPQRVEPIIETAADGTVRVSVPDDPTIVETIHVR